MVTAERNPESVFPPTTPKATSSSLVVGDRLRHLGGDRRMVGDPLGGDLGLVGDLWLVGDLGLVGDL